MALAKQKQAEILTKAKEIEGLILKKYKKTDPNLTFGGKMKSIQDKIKNPFLIDSMWSVIKMRNNLVHDNDVTFSIKEYELFLSLHQYIISKFK